MSNEYNNIIIHFNINYTMGDTEGANYIYKYLTIYRIETTSTNTYVGVPNSHTKCVNGILDVWILYNIIKQARYTYIYL